MFHRNIFISKSKGMNSEELNCMRLHYSAKPSDFLDDSLLDLGKCKKKESIKSIGKTHEFSHKN